MSERIGLHLRGETTIVEHDVMRARAPGPRCLGQDAATARALGGPERWRSAYVHCRKHFPRSDDKPVDWGTDDVKAKGGDYFGAQESTQALAPLRTNPKMDPTRQALGLRYDGQAAGSRVTL